MCCGTGRRNYHIQKAAVLIGHKVLAQPKQTHLVVDSPPAGGPAADQIGKCITALVRSVILFGTEGVKNGGALDSKVNVAAVGAGRKLSLHIIQAGDRRSGM